MKCYNNKNKNSMLDTNIYAEAIIHFTYKKVSIQFLDLHRSACMAARAIVSRCAQFLRRMNFASSNRAKLGIYRR